MLFDTDKLFTIGQFAKLHDINKKTLMWYDETGILKPAVIIEYGYRYYSFQQSSLLEIILMLRELNVSISEIQSFLKNRSVVSLENLLTDKITELDKTLWHLQAIRSVMNEKKQSMTMLRTLEASGFSIIEKPEAHYFVTVNTSSNIPLEKEIELVIEEAKKHGLHRLHDASYGAMLSVKNLYNRKFSDYSTLYIELPFPMQKQGVHIQPKGKYLRTFCKGTWDNLPDCYAEILSYAKQHDLEFYDFAYEKGINELVIDTIDDYITQIEIPIKSK